MSLLSLSELGGLRHRPWTAIPAPQQTSIPATAAVWGPGSPCHCEEGTGDKGLGGQGVKPRLAVNRLLGMELNDAELHDPESVGKGRRRREVQPPALCSRVPCQGRAAS